MKHLTLAEVQETFYLAPSPDCIELRPGQRLVVLGDIHGQYEYGLCPKLLAGGVADEEMNWNGGNTILVQIGDVLDRGNQELECWALLCKLSRQAILEGGHVVLLMGNHERMNMSGDFRCVPEYGREKFEDAFGKVIDNIMKPQKSQTKDSPMLSLVKKVCTRSKIKPVPNWKDEYGVGAFPAAPHKRPYRFATMEPGSILAAPLLSKLKVAVKVGKSVLVHGGLNKTMLHAIGDIPFLNSDVSSFAQRKMEPTPGKSRVQAIYISMGWGYYIPTQYDPLQTRDFGHPAFDIAAIEQQLEKEGMDATVKAVLEFLEGDRLIIGHTTQDTIVGVYGGKVWRVDVGILPQVLEVHREEDTESYQEVVKVLGPQVPPEYQDRIPAYTTYHSDK